MPDPSDSNHDPGGLSYRPSQLRTIAALRTAVDRVRQHKLDRLYDAVVALDDTMQTVAECRIERESGVPGADLGMWLARLERCWPKWI